MSNLEKHPVEVVEVSEPSDGVTVLEPRDVPLGGPRAMPVRRTEVGASASSIATHQPQWPQVQSVVSLVCSFPHMGDLSMPPGGA